MVFSGKPSGTVHEISSQKDLENLANKVNRGTDYQGETFVLVDNIALLCARWTPIGNNRNHFNGSFDGNGKAITGLNISGEMINEGFFGVTGNSAVVKNLELKGKMSVLQNENTLGMLTGSNYGTVTGCKCSVEMEVTIDGSCNNFVGVIAGINNGTGVIENCGVNGDITFKNAGGQASEEALVLLGGVCGENRSGGAITGCDIALAYDISKVKKGLLCIGALCGYNREGARLHSCALTVHTKEKDVTFVLCGLAGKNAGEITGCGRTLVFEACGCVADVSGGGRLEVCVAGEEPSCQKIEKGRVENSIN